MAVSKIDKEGNTIKVYTGQTYHSLEYIGGGYFIGHRNEARTRDYELLRISGNAMIIVKTISSVGAITVGTYLGGIASDGKHIFRLRRSGSAGFPMIYTYWVDFYTKNWKVIKSYVIIPPTFSAYTLEGICTDGKHLWVINQETDDLYQIHIPSYKTVRTINIAKAGETPKEVTTDRKNLYISYSNNSFLSIDINMFDKKGNLIKAGLGSILAGARGGLTTDGKYNYLS